MFIQLWFQTYTTYCDAQTINIVSDSAITFVLLMHNSCSLMLPGELHLSLSSSSELHGHYSAIRKDAMRYCRNHAHYFTILFFSACNKEAGHETTDYRDSRLNVLAPTTAINTKIGLDRFSLETCLMA